MKTLIIIFLSTTLLAGCLNDPQSVSRTTNKEFEAQLLFEHDGCKIYRFYDNYRAIYYTDCRGKMEYSYSQPNGKSSQTIHVQNQTVR